MMLIERRRGAQPALPSFSDEAARSFQTTRQGVRRSLTAIATAERRNRALALRLEAARRRTDTRGWVVQRRERTRHLIELGGLVQKAGLVDLTDDDRATIYGALLELTAKARDDVTGDALLLWRRRGKRAFDLEAGDQTTESQTGRDLRTKAPWRDPV
jgi:hypothetical protein